MDQLPLRALNEFVYCPRLFYLMYVQGLFQPSADTVEGKAQHERAERHGRPRPAETDSENGEEAAQEPPTWPSVPKELYLGDQSLGLIGKLDAVEEGAGRFAPVEAKHGPAPDGTSPFVVEGISLSAGAWGNDQVQLCGQGLVLNANGYTSEKGYLYYRGSRKRVEVLFTPELMDATQRVIAAARACAQGTMPLPLVDSMKCIRCSLVSACLPDEVNFELNRIEEPRRVIPGRDDAGVLYVVANAARVGKKGDSLTVWTQETGEVQVPVKDVAALAFFGNVQVTTQALHLLMASGRHISFLTSAGRLIGTAGGLTVKNPELRRKQVMEFAKPDVALALAREVVAAKIANQRTLLRRNGPPPESALAEMAQMAEAAGSAQNMDSLRGNEGRAARVYFDNLPALFTQDPLFQQSMQGRSKRPPKDPVNAMLSFGYALLLRDLVAACATTGLDPMIGFFHATEHGRPALALDLMEPFRPLIVDSVALRAANTGVVGSGSFHVSPGNVLLTDAGRRAFIGAYEQRMDEMVTHPSFGYRLSYRRVLELEVRLLARRIEGELPEYKPLTTR